MHVTSPRVATIVVILGLSAWPAAHQAQAQGDRPVFRGGVELIQLDVSVLDRKRQPVVGLTGSGFHRLRERSGETCPGVHVYPTSQARFERGSGAAADGSA